MKFKLMIIAFFVFGFTLTSQAQAKRVVAKSQVNQQKRIHQGVKSGELTRKEATHLKKQQRNINRTKKAAKADGVVTRKERAVIRKKQAKANNTIYRTKHNNVDRN